MNKALRRMIVFWSTCLGTFTLLLKLWLSLPSLPNGYGLHRLFGVSASDQGDAYPIFFLASYVAAWGVCKCLGLSEAGKTVEVLYRHYTDLAPAVRPEAQVRHPRLLWFAMAACLVSIALGLWVYGAIIYPSLTGIVEPPRAQLFAYEVEAFFAALGLFCLWFPLGNGGAIARTNSREVTFSNGFTCYVVLWESIAACEIVTVRDVFGITTTMITLKDQGRRTLLALNLAPGAAREQALFAQALREAFRRTPNQ
ncbi:MAG: hypothetical protein V4671_04695 [Armatimonadota bacterium]